MLLRPPPPHSSIAIEAMQAAEATNMPGPFDYVSGTHAQHMFSWFKLFCLLDLYFPRQE